jgi:hypothetical protein
MAKFDPDYALFGTLAGDIIAGTPVEKTRVDYVNRACVDLYGDLRSKKFADVFMENTGDEHRAQLLLNRSSIEHRHFHHLVRRRDSCGQCSSIQRLIASRALCISTQ